MNEGTMVRNRRLAPLVAVFAALAACASPTEQEHAEADEIRLTVGSQTVVITPGGAQGTITLSGASAAVSAAFFDHDGEPVALHDDEYELRVTPADAGVVTFSRSAAFAGTLNRVSSGTTTLDVALFHLEEAHEDFGPHPVTVTVP